MRKPEGRQRREHRRITGVQTTHAVGRAAPAAARLRARWASGESGAGVLARLALAVAFALATTGGAVAEDTRPTEIPYDTPGEVPLLDPNYRQTSHRVVIITDQGLNPRLVELDEGQLVAWISYSNSASNIVFEREVARSMICHSLVNFSIVEDELRSAEINSGEFASFCELKPGRYTYKVIRRNPDVSAKRLDGEILVGDVR